jgi:hypothetical protein
MSDNTVSQLIPIAFFADIFDSGQIKSFAVKGEAKPPRNPIFVTREQEGQDFSANADFRYNEPISWDILVGTLKEFANEPFSAKDAAPLFSPTTFKTNMFFNGDGTPYRGFRCIHNATMSALAAVDADNKSESVLYIGEAIQRIKDEGIEAVIYTTASNKIGDRFRVMIPLAEAVDVDTQQQVVQAICRMLKTKGRPDPEQRIFYLLCAGHLPERRQSVRAYPGYVS